MNRRRFLSVAGAATVVIGTSRCSAGVDYEVRSLAQPELFVTLGAGPVRAIGIRYRSVTPGERDPGALRSAILASRPMHARFLGGFSPSVAALVRNDFELGRTLVLNGWILSVTEARQCALFSLLTA